MVRFAFEPHHQTIDKPRQSAKAGFCCREKQKRAKKKEETILLIFWALFKKFCKRDFCDEVRDFKIPEPEAVAS